MRDLVVRSKRDVPAVIEVLVRRIKAAKDQHRTLHKVVVHGETLTRCRHASHRRVLVQKPAPLRTRRRDQPPAVDGRHCRRPVGGSEGRSVLCGGSCVGLGRSREPRVSAAHERNIPRALHHVPRPGCRDLLPAPTREVSRGRSAQGAGRRREALVHVEEQTCIAPDVEHCPGSGTALKVTCRRSSARRGQKAPRAPGLTGHAVAAPR